MESQSTEKTHSIPHMLTSNPARVVIDNFKEMKESVEKLENDARSIHGAIADLEDESNSMNGAIEELGNDFCSLDSKVMFYETKIKEMDNTIDDLRRTMYKSHAETSNSFRAIFVIQIVIIILQLINFIIRFII